MGGPVDDADDGGMTKTRPFPVRFLVAAAVSGLALVAVGCGSSSPKATPASNKTKTASPAAEPVDSQFCQTARKWQVHELNGDGDRFADDPVAFKQYWTDYVDFIATETRQSPPELRDKWPTEYAGVKQFTPILAKYNYDIARIKAEGTPAELVVGGRFDEGPTPTQQAAQDAVHKYEGRVCQTAQPPAADVSFKGVKPNQAYCAAVAAGDEAAGAVNAEKWSIDAVRGFVTGKAFAANLDTFAATAPLEIKADVLADVDWQRNQQVDVLEKFGYDVRKLFLDGSVEDRAIFQRSDPAIADHYARTAAYEEQLCGQ